MLRAIVVLVVMSGCGGLSPGQCAGSGDVSFCEVPSLTQGLGTQLDQCVDGQYVVITCASGCRPTGAHDTCNP